MTISLEDRFMSHVALGPNGCLDWTGSTDACGYGMFRLGPGKIERAHRVALRSTGIDVTPKDVVMHSCDRPCCVNPKHLSVGTRKLNNADRDAKGRHVPLIGTAHGRAKLTDVDVIAIRSSKENSYVLGQRYGILPSSVRGIKARHTWKHL